MGDSQPQTTGAGSGKEIALLVGVLLLVAAGTMVTYWVRSRNAEAAGQPATATAVLATRARSVAPPPTDAEVVHADVYFDFKSTRLRADAARLLQEKAALMEHARSWAVLVLGYADRQGPAEYNRLLAQRRATSVKQFLVELGVSEPSIKVVTIGQEGSLCDEPSAECAQLNRRVHLEIRRLTRAAAVAEPVRPELAVGDTLDTLSGRRQQP
jgi:outer membrane protein OmpA-like peptidoglycan-associated protein